MKNNAFNQTPPLTASFIFAGMQSWLLMCYTLGSQNKSPLRYLMLGTL